MSMHNFAGAGPIMAGLAAMSEPAQYIPIDAPAPEPSNSEIARMLSNLADQVSEIAAQLVDVRKRLDVAEKAPTTLFLKARQQGHTAMVNAIREFERAAAAGK